jgi:hypothetical protein
VTVQSGGGTGAPLAENTISTDPLPAWLPTLTLTGDPGWSGFFLTSLLGETAAVVLLDEHGTVRWYAQESEPGQLFRVRARRDGQGVYWLMVPDALDGVGSRLVSADWNGAAGTPVLVGESVTHDFVELDDGTVGVIGDNLRGMEANGTPANVILEWDGSSVRQVWSSLDAFPDTSGGFSPAGVWTHANALDWDPELDAWRLGLRNLSAIVTVSRQGGEDLDQIGGTRSEWSFGEGAAWDHQHQFQFLGDRLLVHDNRDATLGSRVVEVALDPDTRTASWIGELVHDPPLYVFAMGDVDRFADDESGAGGTLVTWSSAGVIDDFAPDGSVRASLESEFGTAFGYTQRVSLDDLQTRLR